MALSEWLPQGTLLIIRQARAGAISTIANRPSDVCPVSVPDNFMMKNRGIYESGCGMYVIIQD